MPDELAEPNQQPNVDVPKQDTPQPQEATSNTDENRKWGRMIEPLNPDVKPEPLPSQIQQPVAVAPIQMTPQPTMRPILPQQTPLVGQPTVIAPITTTNIENDSTRPVTDSQLFSMSAPVEKKSKKKLIIIITSIIGVILLGGCASGLYIWYQQPQKSLTDSFVSAITAKSISLTGDVTMSGDGYKLAIDIDSKKVDSTGSLDVKATVTVTGQDFKFDGGGLIDKNGDLYVKLNNLDTLVQQYADYADINSSNATMAAIDKFVDKVNGKWIKISTVDLEQFSESYSDSKSCVNKVTDQMAKDKTMISEVATVYEKNQFIVVDKELGLRDGSYGYTIKGSNTELKSFLDEVKNTRVYKALNECDKNFTIDTTDMDTSTPTEDISDGTFEVWVDMWSHQITKAVIKNDDSESNQKFLATINTKFNQNISIATPASSISLAELKDYINELSMALSGYSSSDYTIDTTTES